MQTLSVCHCTCSNGSFQISFDLIMVGQNSRLGDKLDLILLKLRQINLFYLGINVKVHNEINEV